MVLINIHRDSYRITFEEKHAFSLAELSIVLIIIGLLVAGVSGGSKLIRNTKLMSTINQVSELKTAVFNFQLSYEAYPGDLTNAYDYWGVSAGCTNTLASNTMHSATASETGCNGNGDQRVIWMSGEMFRLWQHLSLSEMMSGAYTGVRGATFDCVVGINCPTSPLSSVSAYSIHEISSKLAIYLAQIGPVNIHQNSGFISPRDAYYIDKKLDDAHPDQGNVTSFNGYNGNAVGGGTQFTTCTNNIVYHVSNNDDSCTIAFSL